MSDARRQFADARSAAVAQRHQTTARRVGPEPLTLAPEEVRRLGYRVVDAFVDHLAGIRGSHPAPGDPVDVMLARVREPAPEGPSDPDAVLDLALEALSAQMHHLDHPRNFARVPGPSNPVGALGDMLATGMNAIAMSASGAPGPTALEVVVLEWLASLLGLPKETEGVLLSGGSVSSLTAFATARAELLGDADDRAVAYLSDQTHSSMRRALRALGFADASELPASAGGRASAGARVRVLRSDDGLRLSVGALRAAVEADCLAGLRPFCVVASAGTTNTGAVDPLDGIAELAAEHGMWMHVDGAYGAPAALTPAGRALLRGIERADSVTLDPHKWLFTPYEIGALLVRRPGALERAFAVAPEYLRDTGGDGRAVNFRDRGPQLTRGSRAVKLWMTLKTFGVAAVRDAIARGIALAELAEAEVRRTPGWEVVTPAQLAVLTFAHERVPAAEIVARAAAAGYASPSSTVVRGRDVVRLCTINPRTTDEDVTATIAHLTELARR